MLGIIFFVLCAASMAETARTNHRALLVDYLIRLSPRKATMFYWGVAALSGGLAALGLLAVAWSLISGERGFIRLTAADIQLMHGLFRKKMSVIRFHDVTAVRKIGIRKHFLEIRSEQRKLSINPKWLPTDAAFDRVCSVIAGAGASRVAAGSFGAMVGATKWS